MRLQEIAPRPFAKVGNPEKVTTVGPTLATRPTTLATPVPILFTEKPRPRVSPTEQWIQRAVAKLLPSPRTEMFRYTATVNDSGRQTYGKVRAASVDQAKAVLAGRGLTPTWVASVRPPGLVRAMEAFVGHKAIPTALRRFLGDRPFPGRGQSVSTGHGTERPPPTLFHDPHRVEPVTAPLPVAPERPDPFNTATSPPTPPAESPRYSPFFHGGMT